MTLELTEEQLDKLADAVAERLRKRQAKAFEKPLTVTEFAQASKLSTSQIYRWVEAGKLRRVPGLGKVLIPTSELERFQ